MTSPKAWEAHDPFHQFFPIQTKDDLSHLAQVVKNLPRRSDRGPPARHLGVTCDGCGKPVEGARHKCLICDGELPCIQPAGDGSKRETNVCYTS